MSDSAMSADTTPTSDQDPPRCPECDSLRFSQITMWVVYGDLIKTGGHLTLQIEEMADCVDHEADGEGRELVTCYHCEHEWAIDGSDLVEPEGEEGEDYGATCHE